MASGSFSASGSASGISVRCDWSSSAVQSGNYSNVTAKIYLVYHSLYMKSRSGSSVTINGTKRSFSIPAINRGATSQTSTLLTTQTVKVWHAAGGTKTTTIAFSVDLNGINYGGSNVGIINGSKSVTLDKITTYKLSVSQGSGGSVSVERTSSGYANRGYINNGAILYKGDTLKIVFTPASNYYISTHTVNGTTFGSGNTHTVSGNVSVVVAAKQSSSAITATDANIESTSTIHINQASSSRYFSVRFTFGSQSGYINGAGNIVSREERFNNSTVYFKIPKSFYNEIPNSSSAVCNLVCKTYNGISGSQVGEASSESFIISASPAYCMPEFYSIKAGDDRESTIAITGDSNVMIRYMSSAAVDVRVTAKNGASIKTFGLNNAVFEDNFLLPDGHYGVYAGSAHAYQSFFIISATDSRGFRIETRVDRTLIPYIPLTCNADVSRNAESSGGTALNITGNFYKGSLGKGNNTLSLKYRCQPLKDAARAYGPWHDIDLKDIVITDGAYRTLKPIPIEEELDYRHEYNIEIWAQDGIPGHVLSSVVKTVRVKKSIPIFDWGEDDFKFHVPIDATNITKNGINVQAYNGVIAEGDNLNSYTTPGIYLKEYSTGTTPELNYPIDNAGMLEVFFLSDEIYAQRYTVYLGQGLFFREHNGGKWQEWKRLDSQDRPYHVVAMGRKTCDNGDPNYQIVWDYTIWNNGMYECSGTYSYQSTMSSPWGSIYYGYPSGRIPYPFAFDFVPVETVTCRCKTAAVACFSTAPRTIGNETFGPNTDKICGSYTPYRFDSAFDGKYAELYFDIRATGYIKNLDQALKEIHSLAKSKQ